VSVTVLVQEMDLIINNTNASIEMFEPFHHEPGSSFEIRSNSGTSLFDNRYTYDIYKSKTGAETPKRQELKNYYSNFGDLANLNTGSEMSTIVEVIKEANHQAYEANEVIQTFHPNEIIQKPDNSRKRTRSVSSESSTSSKKSSTSSQKVEAKKTLKPKARGRYEKKKINISKEPNIHQHVPSSPAVRKLFKTIIEDASYYSEEENRKFLSHLLDKGNYMFIISIPPQESKSLFILEFINCVHSIYNEYINNYMHKDRFVLVLTLEKFRFMISYHLLLKLGIKIPQQDQFSDSLLQENDNQCHFAEITDFEFLNLLTNRFNLDRVFVQAKFSMLLASIGEIKAKSIYKTLSVMIQDNSLFTLPFHTMRKESIMEEKIQSSLYVDEIIKYSRNMKFYICDKKQKLKTSDEIFLSLQFWLRSKDEPSRHIKKKEKNYFTYKFGSIARMLYEKDNKNLNKLVKVKKETGSAKLIEYYLSNCQNLPEAHNFILISLKTDERITIIKKGLELFWITSVMKDIVVSDFTKKYRLYNHYVLSLNNAYRKEVNNRHNGLIRLVSLYISEAIELNNVKEIAVDKFSCNFQEYINK
jgi:Trans-activating transcriptional regulator